MTIQIVPLAIGEATSSVPVLTDLTTGKVDGTGVFDVLMQAVTEHLTAEFNKSRITGKDYASVYLGSMTAVLQQSVAYLSTSKQVEKLNSEIGLLRQKTVTELSQTDDTIPAGLGFNDTTAVEGVMGKQKDLYGAQTTGFTRDAERKIMKQFLDTWAVRRSTDDGTLVDANGLADAQILKIVQKAAEGIGVTITA